ncbi:hypothetical protein C9422_00510 [Pseudomonas sp. B1(2018)]|uniref:hypothetical protein n=1 Tax=Pseudomonas sp. B1(2018) TaxID=2233856 RepID=UPI000D5EDC24|nr:hypothetical protein [Pseudomonas sp. B1(2018)]PVZ62019.1 hypothetical protein C9422_00510 [Pseudomonas sp. B1(2018)]
MDSVLVAIAKLKCINVIGLAPAVFQDIPAKFIDQFRQRCAAESIRKLQSARVLLTQGVNDREVAIRLKIGKTVLYDALRETDQKPQKS